MARAIFQTKTFTGAILKFPEKTSVKQNVSDGDTLRVFTNGTFGVRLLGVDSPESRFPIVEELFVSVGSEKWQKYFAELPSTDYFNNLPSGLREFLEPKIQDDPSGNQYLHAKETERILESEVQKDISELNKKIEEFEFFMAFAHEILDRYGRFLGYINRSQLEGQRPLAYNERLLQKGFVIPYFIWPNINPFRKQSDPFSSAYLKPDEFWKFTNSDYSLQRSRKWVKENREKKLGVFREINILQLLPFEFRFLGRKELPNRYVIDLEKGNNEIIQPENYYTIGKIEDRLFLPAEYVPLFEKNGWRII